MHTAKTALSTDCEIAYNAPLEARPGSALVSIGGAVVALSGLHVAFLQFLRGQRLAL